MSGGEWERVTGFASGVRFFRRSAARGLCGGENCFFLFGIFGIRGKRSVISDRPGVHKMLQQDGAGSSEK